jgi:transcriptional regulator with XRE-family HTH domain
MHISTNIKFIRELAGLTQQEFGEVLGVNKDKIYNLENNRGKVDSIIIAKIANIVGVAEKDIEGRKLSLKDVDEGALKRKLAGNKKVPESGESDTYKDKYIALLEARVKELEARPLPGTDIESHLSRIREDQKQMFSLLVSYQQHWLKQQLHNPKKFAEALRSIQQSALEDQEQLLTQGKAFFEGTDGNSKS